MECYTPVAGETGFQGAENGNSDSAITDSNVVLDEKAVKLTIQNAKSVFAKCEEM